MNTLKNELYFTKHFVFKIKRTKKGLILVDRLQEIIVPRKKRVT